MPFLKYPSIDNSHQQKIINRWLKIYPELADVFYVAEEKIHGTNIQTVFDIGKPMKVGRRNDLLYPGESFYDIWTTLYSLVRPLRELQKYSDAEQIYLNVYWEYFGRGINSGVDYFDYKTIRCIGIRINGVLQPPIVKNKVFADLCLSHLLAPVVKMEEGLDKILEVSVERLTWFNPTEGNFAEGIVIKPFNKVYFSAQGSPFMLKKKHPKFAEKASTPKKKKKPNTEVEKMNNIFQLYITEQRLQNVFSKYGPIKELKQLGDFIKYMLADAQADFFKDHDEKELESFNKAERRQVFNVGATIANMLKKHL